MNDIQNDENPNSKLKENVNENVVVKWKNRRRMAWTSLISMLIVMILLLFGPITDSRLTILSDPITWFFFAMASIIGAYMSVTTWAHIKGK